MLQILDVSEAQTQLQFSQLTQLEGFQYLFDYTWDARLSVWYLNISDQDSNPLCLNIALVVSWSLLLKFRYLPNIPPGFLFCVDQTNTDTDVLVPADFGVRVPFFYITSDDPRLVGKVF